AAALALEMGPGPHQPAPLVFEMRELDLQRALARRRPLAEDVEDEPGAVDHLAVPSALEIALLHGRERRIDDHDGDALPGDRAAGGLDLPLAQQRRGTADPQREDGGMDDDQADRGGEADRLGEARL